MQIAVEAQESRLQLLSPLVVNERDGSVMVLIPSGEFVMGDGQDENCPAHEVYLDAYFIGVYPVTNHQYKLFVDAGGAPPAWPDEPGAVWNGRDYLPEFANHPVTCVAWQQACDYCEWAGLHMPTEAQWERAMRGPENLVYPWGNTWTKGRCHCEEAGADSGACPVYEYPSGVSGFGVMNGCGNVWEWCWDWLGRDYYLASSRDNPSGPAVGGKKVTRGGAFNSFTAFCRCAFRNGEVRTRAIPSLGFRVARRIPVTVVPEEGEE